ncbi:MULTISPECIES: hypothetical protein [Nonomuraea]|uniref:Uncharacterized protein n=1 Tax=Nonomuraea ferruginea TaxID=46174 RepID=A0ABT4SVB3_9ACTN|nr:hypothetical protein [Nonomuraea ferruginea]MDA0640969.1 hypothetical protein [Nonomuraea ferruginea]
MAGRDELLGLMEIPVIRTAYLSWKVPEIQERPFRSVMFTRWSRPVLAGLCCATLMSCGFLDQDRGEPRHRYSDITEFGHVVANAFRITHPEYSLTRADWAWEREEGEMAVELGIEPLLGPETGASANFLIRQDSDSGRLYYTEPYGRAHLQVENVLHELDTLPDTTALTMTLRRLGRSGAETVPAKKEVDEVLKEIGRTKDVTAVVEWKKPMTAEDVRSRKHLHFDNAILAPPTRRDPIVYWDYSPRPYCQSCQGSSDRMTQSFEAWVNRLEPSDEPALRHFGLSLDRLRKAASGKSYGYIEQDANPVLLRKLLKLNHVKTMYIVRTRDHCEDDEHGECVPAAWPKDDDQLYG